MSDVQIWRYNLPPVSKEEIAAHPWLPKFEEGQGWATILVGSDGFFSAVSDYGNYAFRWCHHGCNDFREFLLNAERSPDYFVVKLSTHPWPYNGPDTLQAVKKYILEARREGIMEKEIAREEWDLLEDNEDLDNEMVFWDWCRSTSLGDAHEFGVHKAPSDVTCFVTKTMRRLCVLLRQDLGLTPKEEPDDPTNPDRVADACEPS